jgi:hypothetical protein
MRCGSGAKPNNNQSTSHMHSTSATIKVAHCPTAALGSLAPFQPLVDISALLPARLVLGIESRTAKQADCSSTAQGGGKRRAGINH